MTTTILAPDTLIGDATNNKQDMFDISIFEVIDGKVNLTKMCKHFGKEIKRWSGLPSSKQYLQALESVDGKSVITVLKGNFSNGETQGTFGTREVAIKVSQWISPQFEVFCIKKLDELFQTGRVELQPQGKTILTINADFLEQVTKKMRQIEEEKEKLTIQNTRLLHSAKTYTTTEIAKELGYRSAMQFNKLLEEMKIQYKINSTWVLSSKYSDKGYTDIKQTELDSGKIVYDRLWTGLGRDFLLAKFGVDVALKDNLTE